jgi:hypothetical protein
VPEGDFRRRGDWQLARLVVAARRRYPHRSQPLPSSPCCAEDHPPLAARKACSNFPNSSGDASETAQ